jgi:hypothetical protein
MNDDELRAALRAEAASHRPDRDAMLHRITSAAMTPGGSPSRHARRGGPRVRMAAAAAAVATVLAGGGVANWALAGNEPDHVTPTLRPTPSPSPSVTVTTTPAPAPATSKPSPSRTPDKSPTSTPRATAGTGVEHGPLWSDGSIDPDSGDTQGASVVTLKTTERLTRLEVVIRVARTDGLVSRGGTKQTPGASVTTTVTEEADTVRYRFVMTSADTLQPGTYTFTAKYRYPSGGRNAGDDTYTAAATTAGDADLHVNGDFS